MELQAVALIAATLMAGAALQSAIGFGIGLLAVPLLLMQGLELPYAVATLLGAAVVQTGWGSWTYRSQIHTELTIPIGSAQVLGVPVGVYAMGLVSDVGPVWVRLTVSVAILLSLAVWSLWEPDRVEELPVPVRLGTGFTSGMLGGMAGMAGPPLVLYGLCHDWEKDRFRVFLWSQMCIGIPMVLSVLVWQFGPQLLWNTAIGIGCAPLVWLAFQGATRATASWDGTLLRRAAIGLLMAVAVTNVVAAL